MSAEDLKLAEFILTKPEDRLKRKGSTDANSRIDHDDAIDSDYEESEEEIAMIMKKGSLNKIHFLIVLLKQGFEYISCLNEFDYTLKV